MSGSNSRQQQGAPAAARKIYISLENNSSVQLNLMSFFLVAGGWDADAPSGSPAQESLIRQGSVWCWATSSPVLYNGLTGGMVLRAKKGQLGINWAWDYGGNPAVTGTLSIPDLKTSIDVTHQTKSQITARIVVLEEE